MPLVIATWPNGDLAVVLMRKGFTAVDLYEELDAVGPPGIAKCYVARPEFGEMLVAAERTSDESEHPHVWAVEAGRVKRFKWPCNVANQHSRSVYRRSRGWAAKRDEMSDFQATAGAMPDPPGPQFSAEEINKMPPFSGVYVSWDSDGKPYYVGESVNVPSRVRSSRPEIADRAIGIIRCDPRERRRIECYLIGVLDPPGNSQSTHRMGKQSGDDQNDG